MTYSPDTIPLQPAYVGKPTRSADKAAGGDASISTHITGFTGAARLQSFRHTVTGAKSMLVASNSLRRTLLVKNEGSNDVFIGGEDVSTANGYRLATTDALTLEVAGEVYVLTAGTSETLYCLVEMDG